MNIVVHGPGSMAAAASPEVEACLSRGGHEALYCHPQTVQAIAGGLSQDAYFIEARDGNRIIGVLPLVHLQSRLFGSFLVSLPYVSWGGVVADTPQAAAALVERAVALAGELDADNLELRQIGDGKAPGLVDGATHKVQMRVGLDRDPDVNWRALKQEVRTQVRKATKAGLSVTWGGSGLIEEFYAVFARNMRDLGTPVFPQRLFHNLLSLDKLPAEIGIVRLDGQPIAACLAVHGPGLTEIPSAAALREHRKTAANSLMYWHAMERAIERKQDLFDFGRSTPGSATYEFKRKWGAVPVEVHWQYHVRRGDTAGMRPESRKFQLARRVWQHLPVYATRVLGPHIVRGIP